MADRQVDLTRLKGGHRSKRILALIPKRGHTSDYSCSDDSADEENTIVHKKISKPPITIPASDEESSPAPSLCSSYENLNISYSEDDRSDCHSPVLDIRDIVEKCKSPNPVCSEVKTSELTDKTTVNSCPQDEELCSTHEIIQCEPSNIILHSPAQNPSTPREVPKVIQPKRKTLLVKKPVPTKRKKKNITNNNIESDWKVNAKIDFSAELPSFEDNFTLPAKIEDPLSYFSKFFSEDIIQLIVEQSNLYGVQKSGTYPNITGYDIKDFLAINIFMGIVSMPAYTDFWALETRYEKIAKIMPLKKYQKIRKFIHFADNSADDGDRYYKIRPVLMKIRENCLSIDQEGRYSIDEMMVPYKGTRAGNRRQYIKGKPKKWGFKIFVRAGVSGIVYDFTIYGGDDTFRFDKFTDVEDKMGHGAKVVIALSKSIKNPACSVVYFDNFFTSLDLVSYLREEFGIFSLGTLRSNRLKGAKDCLKTDKQLKKSGRGSFCQVISTKRKVAIVKWFDNKAIHLVSSFVDSYPIDHVLRYSKEAKTRTRVQCPQVVKQYNTHMGGVDLADMLVALYRTDFRGHRWYLPIFSQMLDICINNAWLLYRRDNKLLNQKPAYKLKEFRVAIANALLVAGRDPGENIEFKEPIRNNPTGPLPNDSVRYDCFAHWPASDKKGRCRFCKSGQTTIMCKKCKVRLCLTDKRNCFEAFHKKS